MHPILVRFGDFPIGTYGLLLTFGFFLALLLARRHAREAGIDPEAITDLAISLLIAGVVGAKLAMIVVELAKGVPMAEVFSLATLRAGGAVHGGIIGGVIVFFWRMKKHHLPLDKTMDILAVAIPVGQAIGRLGCFMAGCCYGTECHHAWAVTFTDIDARMLSGTPLEVPLHPVQLYTFVMNATVFGILMLLKARKRFDGQLVAAYFLLEGLGRAIVEVWRGDLDRGAWFDLPWLSTGRLTAFAFILFGLGLWTWLSRRAPAQRA